MGTRYNRLLQLKKSLYIAWASFRNDLINHFITSRGRAVINVGRTCSPTPLKAIKHVSTITHPICKKEEKKKKKELHCKKKKTKIIFKKVNN